MTLEERDLLAYREREFLKYSMDMANIRELLQKIYEQMVEQNKFVESRLNDIVTNTRRKTG